MNKENLSVEKVLEMVKNLQITSDEAYTLIQNLKDSAKKTDEYTAPAGHSVMYFSPQWQEAAIQAGTGTKNLSSALLVFGSGKEMLNTLKEKAGSAQRFIFVEKGKDFKETDESTFTINPEVEEHYSRLISTLKSRNVETGQVVHLWLLGKSETVSKAGIVSQEVVNCGINSIFHLIKAFAEVKIKALSRFIVGFSAEKDHALSLKQAIGGYSRSLGLVFPNLAFTAIELPETNDDLQNTSRIIMEELQADTKTAGYEVKYESGRRYVRKVKRIELQGNANSIIRNQGVYLITGGAGALGVLFARHMAKKYSAKLVLTGRSALNQKIQESINQLKALGAEVLYVQADISNMDDMERVVRSARERFGAINGILHAAGIVSDKIVVQKELKDFERILDPKVKGTLILDELTREENLDFFALFSSTSSVIGDFGQCDYAVSNRFLDSFAQSREELRKENKRKGKTVAINWPLWKDGGMHLDNDGEYLYLQTSGMSYLQTESGINSFEKILETDASQVMVISGDPKRVEKFLKINEEAVNTKEQEKTEAVQKEKAAFKPLQVQEEGQPMEYSIQKDIQRMAAEILKVNPDRLDVEENLGDFGFDSVSLKDFADRLSETYGVEVSPTVFFARSSLKGLGEYLVEEFGEQMKNFYTRPAAMELQPEQSVPVRVEQSIQTIHNQEPVQFAQIAQASQSETSSKPISSRFGGSRLDRQPGVGTADKAAQAQKGKSVVKMEPVAIIGASGMLPKAENLDVLWNYLEAQTDLVDEIPANRWDWRDYYSVNYNDKNRTNSKWGGFIEDFDKFDAKFFSISPREAQLMDPQHRVFIQTVWKTIEDSGYKVSHLSGKKVGVYVGVQFTDYQQLLSNNLTESYAQSSTGNAVALLSNRVSYLLNFRGPSESIDTACSSSLVALHRAVKSVQLGESELAIAGGVSLLLDPNTYVGAGTLGVFSPDGRCKTFDSSANGYVKGEGVGAVLLKPLSKAIEDRDHIYAVILGSAENHGGKANSLTAPNSEAQAELLVKAYEEAGIDPATVSYIEAHGTGTQLGDPVEIDGLKKAFRELYSKWNKPVANKAHVALGSIKTNIGHLEPASGIAGVIKTILAMKQKKLPGLVHFKELNPYIELKNSPFYVVDKTRDWEALKDENGNMVPRRAGVSSFGFGGANAHVVLEEFVQPDVRTMAEADTKHLIVLSAKNQERLKEYALSLYKYLEKDVRLSEVAYTLLTGRDEMEERLAMVISSKTELREKLYSYYNGNTVQENVYAGNIKASRDKGELSIKGQAQNSPVQNALSDRDLPMLAQMWVDGYGIDFSLLFQGYKPYRVSLPSYPFAKDRYWIPDEGKNKKTALIPAISRLHAVIDSNESTLYEQCFKKKFTGEEFYIKDHGSVLPGVVYLEMVRAAGNLADRQSTVRKIRNVVWANPVIVSEEQNEVYISLQPNGNAVDFEVKSTGTNGEKVGHGQGKIFYARDAGSNENPEYIDIEAVKSRCRGGREDARAYYALLETLGAKLGSRFQGILELYCNQDEAITCIGIPEELEDSFSDYVIHPTLADGGLQSSVSFAYKMGYADSEILYVPFVLGEIEIFDPTARVCHAYVRMAGVSHETGSQTLKFIISFLDKDGKVALKMKELSIRPVQQVMKNALMPGAEKNEVLYFQQAWEKTLHVPQVASGPSNSSVIVLDYREEVYSKLKQAEKNNNVYWVKPGKKYSSLGDNTFEINTINTEDYQELLEELKLEATDSIRIVYLLGRGTKNFEKNNMEQEVYPVFYLSKALLSMKLKANIEMLCMVASEREQLEPQYAAIGGFARTLRLENQKFICKTVHVHTGMGDTTYPASQLFETAVREFSHGNDGGIEVRYTNGHRYIKALVEVEVPKDVNSLSLVKENGVYIITGGIGGLGMIFAKHLGQKYKARLILAGRSPLNDKMEEKIREIRATGAEVLYVKSDVSVKEEAFELIRRARLAFGEVNGVIHCAGVIRDSLLVRKDLNELDEVMASKVYGTINLDEAMGLNNLDFFVMFSSSTSLLGNMGQSDYAYANSFVDNYARVRASSGRKGKTLAINWPLWAEGGMQVDEQTQKLIFTNFGMDKLSTTAGLEALEKGLSLELSQLMVVEGDAKKLRKAVAGQNIQTQKTKAPVEQTKTGDATLAKNFQKDFISIVSDILKTPESDIDLQGNMSDFGFDSITFTELANKVNDKFKMEITPTVFFDNPSPAAIVSSLYEQNQDRILEYYKDKVKVSGRESQSYTAKQDYGTAGQNFAVEQKLQNAPQFRSGLQSRFDASMKQELMGAIKEDLCFEPIAVVGMSGVMPQSEDLEEFWKHIENKDDLITEIPYERWDWKLFYGTPHKDHNKTNIKWGGFMKEVDKFDPLFFNIAPRDAEMMDPQERIMLEVVWKTIEGAGYRASDISGTRTAVFIGVSNADYQELLIQDDVVTTMTRTMITNRISYLLNINGPSEPIDTACSSSLTAIHRAVEAIWYDNCEMAIAGGINIMVSPNLFIAGSSFGMLSEDGKCKTFDKSANGYVRGEGAGAVLLKPLSKAIADGDYIHGVIRGTAVNHGGRASSLTAPNSSAQADVMIRAYEKAAIDPSTISYIETHGTGTSLGDPIEIEGLKKAFKELYKRWGKEPGSSPHCGIGSVKTNIGHLEPGSGIAGVFKILLAMKNKKLPASINCVEVNPYIQLEGSPFYLVNETMPWKQMKDENHQPVPRRAGISSFGVGGSNAHVIIEEFDNSIYALKADSDQPSIVVLSAKSEDRLKAYCQSLAAFLEDSQVAKNQAKLPSMSEIEEKLQEDVLEDLCNMAAELLMIDSSDVNPEEDINEYGLDAVNMIKLLDTVDEKYNLDMQESFTEFKSLRTLAGYLVENYGDVLSHIIQTEVTTSSENDGETSSISLQWLAYTLQIGREPMEERLALVVSNIEELVSKLKDFCQGKNVKDNLYRGSVKPGKTRLGLIIEGEEGKEFITNLIMNKKFSKLAQLWTEGMEINWKELYMENPVRRIPLPTYPFEKERYWLPKPRNSSWKRESFIFEEAEVENSKSSISSLNQIDRIETHLEQDGQDGESEMLLYLLKKLEEGQVSAEEADDMMEGML